MAAMYLWKTWLKSRRVRRVYDKSGKRGVKEK
jgi:hypothetical protein